MKYAFSATGTPAQINNEINAQMKAAAKVAPQDWPTLLQLRNDVARYVADKDPGEQLTVSVSLGVSVSAAPVPVESPGEKAKK